MRKPRATTPRRRPAPQAHTHHDGRGQLDGFIARYTPRIGRIARGALARMRHQFRGTRELAYDNYNALAIGWSPTGRTSDVICSIALYPKWVSVFFMHGTRLPDPHGRLRGSGKRVRHIVLKDARTLDEPAVRALLAAAIEQAHVTIHGRARPDTIVMSVSAKQRPRRPATP